MAKNSNYYARLGLPIDASPEEVRHAYRDAARRLHPDLNTAPGETEFFLDTQEAYEVLSDPARRAVYNANLPKEIIRSPQVVLNVNYSRPSIHRSNEPQLVYALLEIEPPKEEDHPSRRPQLNVCILLDCSTSMQGPVLDTVKLSAIEFVRQLKSTDVFSLITFNDRAEIVVPGSLVSDLNRIENRIRMLRAGGGTEIFRGLEAAFSEVSRTLRPSYINHIFMLTDGHTYGDEPKCLKLVNKMADLGIGLTAFGIGSKWNDVFLDTLASRTGGTSVHITAPQDIHPVLKQKFRGLALSYAESVIYRFETSEFVKLKYAFRLRPEVAPLELDPPLNLGPLPKHNPLHVIFEFEIAPFEPDTQSMLLSKGFVTISIPERQEPVHTSRLVMEQNVEEEPSGELPPPAIMQAMARLTLYRLQEKAHKEIEDGKFQDASRRLQHLATHLMAQGENELARTALKEAAHIQNNHAFSEEGNKRVKYGTRALLLPDSTLSNPSKLDGALADGDEE